MTTADRDSAGIEPRLPKLAHGTAGLKRKRNRQIDSKPIDGDFAILVLAAPLAGLTGNSGRSMGDHYRRFRPVAVLPART